MKRFLLMLGACCWLLFAAGFGALLFQYFAQGAGLQFFGWMLSPVSVVLGTVHVIGLLLAAGLCFAAGAVLWGLALTRRDPKPRELENKQGP